MQKCSFLLRRKKKNKKIKYFHHFLFQQQKASNVLFEGSSLFCSHFWSYGRNWDHNCRFSQLHSSFKLVTFYHCRSDTDLPQVTIKKYPLGEAPWLERLLGPRLTLCCSFFYRSVTFHNVSATGHLITGRQAIIWPYLQREIDF